MDCTVSFDMVSLNSLAGTSVLPYSSCIYMISLNSQAGTSVTSYSSCIYMISSNSLAGTSVLFYSSGIHMISFNSLAGVSVYPIPNSCIWFIVIPYLVIVFYYVHCILI